jgi:hypothetical protein
MRGKSFAQFINYEKFTEVTKTHPKTQKQKVYSPSIKSPNFFAPVKTHKLALLLILSMITKVGDSL